VAAGLVAMAADAPRRLAEALVALLVLAAAAGVALVWPYFSLWALATGASVPNTRNMPMYSWPLLRTFPALLGVPPLIVNGRRSGRWSVAAWVAILFVIYLVGFATGNYVFGRVIFFMVFLLQLELARFVVRRESTSIAGDAWPAWILWTGAAVALCVTLSARPLVRTARDVRWGERTGDEYAFLRDDVGQYDVMMTEGRSSSVAASFGGKLVAAENPLPFVAESTQRTRRSDVATFFSAATTERERRELLRKYDVSFVLAPRSTGVDSASVSESAVRALGSVTHADRRFLLVRVDSSVRR